ncbi:MAG: hypothetical protein ACTHOR_04260 [Devosia sp.]
MRKTSFFVVALVSAVGFAGAALAEDNDGAPPNCPGGNLKGTFTCTGPLLHQTCTEGPPWHCEHPPSTDPPKATLGNPGTGGHGRNFGNIKNGNNNLTVNGNSGQGSNSLKGKLLFQGGTHKKNMQ